MPPMALLYSNEHGIARRCRKATLKWRIVLKQRNVPMAIALNKTSLFLTAAALTIALFGNGGASRAGEAIAGEYACESMAGRPCDTHVPLRLQDNGYWGWAKY